MFDLVWKAIFKDGRYIRQFEENDIEHPFKEVLENQDNLIYFFLENPKNKYTYVVDLNKGCIFFCREGSYLLHPREDMLRKTAYKYRLIYFREVERTFGSNLKEIGEPKVLYFIGFQYTDKDNSNHKRMMRIHPNGEFVIN